MIHDNEQQQIFYILKHLDYSETWEEIEYGLGYILGDHRFESRKTYEVVRLAAKNLWVVLNGFLNSDGEPRS